MAGGRVTRDAASTIGVLYGVNTLGASVGAFASVWYLVGAYGFEDTIRLAAVLNFLAAAGAVAVWRAMAACKNCVTPSAI